MKLDVIVGTAAELSKAVPAPTNMDTLKEYYGKLLCKAAEERTDYLNLSSIISQENRSSNFKYIEEIERCILDHFERNDHPRVIRIICSDESIAKLYKTVYNFWFAESKASRLNDENWD